MGRHVPRSGGLVVDNAFDLEGEEVFPLEDDAQPCEPIDNYDPEVWEQIRMAALVQYYSKGGGA